MKASHLAALCLAGLGIGGMSAAAIQAPVISGDVYPTQNQKAAVAKDTLLHRIMHVDMGTGALPISQHPVSWKKLNQRQIRKNRRRAFAAGDRKAFA